MSFKEGTESIDRKRAREYNALTRIPEEMSVSNLIIAIRDLREMLYQSRLKSQNHECWNDDD